MQPFIFNSSSTFFKKFSVPANEQLNILPYFPSYNPKVPSPSKYPLIKCLIRFLSLKTLSFGNVRVRVLHGVQPLLFNCSHMFLFLTANLHVENFPSFSSKPK